jgi:tripeptide aminopeptidase
MDTGAVVRGASEPKLSGRKIVNTAKTALGGDNRTAAAFLSRSRASLPTEARPSADHALFCVREESGLYGRGTTSTEADLGAPAMAFNYDGGSASNVGGGAVRRRPLGGRDFGRASHAGVRAERGISSTMILALALAEVKKGGWFGKVVKGKEAGHQQCRPGDRRPAGPRAMPPTW